MDNQWVNQIEAGQIGVIPTDTLYGLVGSALSPAAVEQIYRVRARDLDKPLIVLITNESDLSQLGIKASVMQKQFMAKYWPGPVSAVLPCPLPKFEYLHRGTGTLAVRLPDNRRLCQLIAQAGPIVAPSANPQSQPPAETLEQAQQYFGDQVDFYVEGGRLAGPPSTLVDLTAGQPKVLRGQL